MEVRYLPCLEWWPAFEGAHDGISIPVDDGNHLRQGALWQHSQRGNHVLIGQRTHEVVERLLMLIEVDEHGFASSLDSHRANGTAESGQLRPTAPGRGCVRTPEWPTKRDARWRRDPQWSRIADDAAKGLMHPSKSPPSSFWRCQGCSSLASSYKRAPASSSLWQRWAADA